MSETPFQERARRRYERAKARMLKQPTEGRRLAARIFGRTWLHRCEASHARIVAEMQAIDAEFHNATEQRENADAA